jgi:rhodanese-related sulfurtransferase
MSLLSFLGLGNKLKDALRNGAVIIDVRTAHEYDQGRIRDSINIPVDRISANIQRIKLMKKPIVFVCSSGQRSAQATTILKQAGVKEVYNGSNWERVLKMMNNL